jgi:hypothetical protein
MKQKAIFLFLILLSVSLSSCSDNPINTVTIQNWTEYDVSLNFKGTLTDVPAGTSTQLTDILNGEYEYETIFAVPNGAAYAVSETCAGTLVLKAGTKVLIIYTSSFDGTTYSLSASITTSENLSEGGILPDPISP